MQTDMFKYHLPPELLFYFISFLPLTSLIAARGVCTRWRSFVQRANPSARKVLLDLYLAAIDHPNFPGLVEALRPFVHEFDRAVYIADLVARGCVLPDLFELWVREWPTKAVHFWAWPGLSIGNNNFRCKYYHREVNALDIKDTRPTVISVPVPNGEAAAVGGATCRVLALWEVGLWCSVGVAQLWLVVDANEGINDRRMGRLLWTYSNVVGRGPDGLYQYGPKKTFYDPPFGPPTDFKLVGFLDLLDLGNDQIEEVLSRYYSTGVHLIYGD